VSALTASLKRSAQLKSDRDNALARRKSNSRYCYLRSLGKKDWESLFSTYYGKLYALKRAVVANSLEDYQSAWAALDPFVQSEVDSYLWELFNDYSESEDERGDTDQSDDEE